MWHVSLKYNKNICFSFFRFRPENQKLVVNIGDRLNIICPNYTSYVNESEMEYYAIYMVSKNTFISLLFNSPLLIRYPEKKGSQKKASQP